MDRDLARRLSTIELPDTDGSTLPLGSLWAEQPCVLLFLRHWG
ncbi:MAG: hypothetical protein ACYTG4_14335 [Planctomycetota bacterium]|jgi:hypothetical protein